jgi:recombination protein RecA
MELSVELPRTAGEKEKAIEQAVAGIEKEHGKGSVFALGKSTGIIMPHVPTGVYSLDHHVLGIGGFPRGRVVEIFGPESSGKTTIALTTVAAAQRAGGRAAYVDPENALDPSWAGKLGVDTKNLLVSQPDTGEEALDITERFVESGAFDVIVVDSVSALVPKAELEGDFGDSLPGLQARLMSQAMRKLGSKVRRSQCVLIFINQIRERIGVMFGSPETTSGGRALKFFASVRLDIRKTGILKEGETPYGNSTKIKAVKNKVGTPYREALVELLFAGNRIGFNREGDLLEQAAKIGLVEKTGSWYNFKGERLGQGLKNASEFIANNDVGKNILSALITQVQTQNAGG